MTFELSPKNVLEAFYSSPYLTGAYYNFVFSASTPTYFGNSLTMEQVVLRNIRNVLGFHAEADELAAVLYSDAAKGECEEEMGDVLFWFANIAGATLACEDAVLDDSFDAYAVVDALEKWSRDPENKREKMEAVHKDLLIDFTGALQWYTEELNIEVDSVESLRLLLEELAVKNYEKLTAAPRITKEENTND